MVIEDLGDFRHAAYTQKSLKDVNIYIRNSEEDWAWYSILSALPDEVLATGVDFSYEEEELSIWGIFRSIFEEKSFMTLCGNTCENIDLRPFARTLFLDIIEENIGRLPEEQDDLRQAFYEVLEVAKTNPKSELVRKRAFEKIDPFRTVMRPMTPASEISSALWSLFLGEEFAPRVGAVRRILMFIKFRELCEQSHAKARQKASEEIERRFKLRCIQAWREL